MSKTHSRAKPATKPTQADKLTEVRRAHKSWEFPDFKAQEFFGKKNKYAVCIFVINEGEKVQKQLKRMKQFSDKIDIIVADGGSTDGSLEPDFLKTVDVRTLLTKTGKGKLSAQMRMAFAYVLHEGYEGVVVVDGNGKDDISAIPDFIRLLDKGYDHIQGSRFIPGGHAINTPLERHLAVHFIHAPLISLAARHRHTDTTNGFRAYSKSLLSDPEISVFRDIFQTYELHYYLAIESARRGYKLIETPVTRAYPKKGKTPTKISPVKGNAHVMGVLVKAVRGKYRPVSARN
jgi:dolichol-phosphate mannosyltransferase